MNTFSLKILLIRGIFNNLLDNAQECESILKLVTLYITNVMLL